MSFPNQKNDTENITTTLLLIDVQNDFHPGGSLAIPTAHEDSHRIAQLIRTHSHKITRVVATMDSHVKLHIAHAGFWVSGADGKSQPDPFTIIESKDIVNGTWKPRSDLKVPGGTFEKGIFGSSLHYLHIFLLSPFEIIFFQQKVSNIGSRTGIIGI